MADIYHASLAGADLHDPKPHKTTHQAGGSDVIDVTGLVGTHAHDYQSHVVTAGEAVSGIIVLTGGKSYTIGNNSLMVARENAVLQITVDYAETNTTTITFVAGVLATGQNVQLWWWK